MSDDKYSFAIELIIQAACFYAGVVLFLCICLIPPLTILLPYIIPVTFIVCMVMNIGLIVRFVKGTTNEIKEYTDELTKDVNLDFNLDTIGENIMDVMDDIEDSALDARDSLIGEAVDATRSMYEYSDYMGYYMSSDETYLVSISEGLTSDLKMNIYNKTSNTYNPLINDAKLMFSANKGSGTTFNVTRQIVDGIEFSPSVDISNNTMTIDKSGPIKSKTTLNRISSIRDYNVNV